MSEHTLFQLVSENCFFPSGPVTTLKRFQTLHSQKSDKRVDHPILYRIVFPEKYTRTRFEWALLTCLPLLTIFSGACVTLQKPPELPSRFSKQIGMFHLISDISITDPRFVAELEFLRTEIRSLLGLDSEHPSMNYKIPMQSRPINIYLFRTFSEYQNFFETYYPDLPERRAYFIGTDIALDVYTCQSPQLMNDLRHELTHALLHTYLEDVPLWIDEGLAEYFEVPGGWNTSHATALIRDRHQKWYPDLASLEQLKDTSEMTSQDYRESWAWVHFFLHGPQEAHRFFRKQLDKRTGDRTTLSFSRSIQRIMPNYNTAFLDHLEQGVPPRSPDSQSQTSYISDSIGITARPSR